MIWRMIDAVYALSARVWPRGPVAWGARAGDWQLGSEHDRYVCRLRDQAARQQRAMLRRRAMVGTQEGIQRAALAFADSLTPQLRAAERAAAAFGRAYAEQVRRVGLTAGQVGAILTRDSGMVRGVRVDDEFARRLRENARRAR